MTSIHFNRYLARFEKVISGGVELGVIGRDMPISVREGKLYYSRFAKFIGINIDDPYPFAIDYYGYFKKSVGLRLYLREIQEDVLGKQLKTINTTIVIFNSIRIEDIKVLTNDQYILWGFIEFKDTILNRRGLGNKRRVIAA